MIRSYRLTELQALLSADLRGSDVSVNSVSTDTRTIHSGDLFVALRGERYDAHDYLNEASAAGAAALVVEAFDSSCDLPQLVVASSLDALSQIAMQTRADFAGKLVGITGSCGKTTVKEITSAILGKVGRTHSTKGNLNNHIGVPLTLLELSEDADFAVVEMGASGLGEIAHLADLGCPDVALVNNVAPAHLEGFGCIDKVAYEKSRIFHGLKIGGTAVVNVDCPYSSGWLSELNEKRSDLTVLTFSVEGRAADCLVKDLELQVDGSYQFTLTLPSGKGQVKMNLMGASNVANAVAAAACCHAMGISMEQILVGLASVEPVSGRLYPHLLESGNLIIDDSYNANPAAVKTAVSLLRDLAGESNSDLLVLGELAELGEGEVRELAELGESLARARLSHLITVGDGVHGVGQSFMKSAEQPEYPAPSDHQLDWVHCRDHSAAIQEIKSRPSGRSVILVKGSRSARMEVVAQALIEHEEERTC